MGVLGGLAIFGVLLGLVVLGAAVLNPDSKLHKQFCTRCRRRARYMQ